MCRLKTLIVAALAICIFWLADGMAAEPLLACVMAGIVTANRRYLTGIAKALTTDKPKYLLLLGMVITMAICWLQGVAVESFTEALISAGALNRANWRMMRLRTTQHGS